MSISTDRERTELKKIEATGKEIYKCAVQVYRVRLKTGSFLRFLRYYSDIENLFKFESA